MNITFDNASFSYAGGIEALRSLTLEIPSGETLVLAGHNGAGKSTMLKLLNGILRPGGGTIAFDDTDTASFDTARMASCVCITFQNPSDQIFASTVLREVTFGPKHLKRPHAHRLASEALEMVGLSGAAEIHPYDLPSASRKLLTIASAIAADTPVLAFDEPTVGLSQPERRLLSAAFTTLQRRGKTLLLISHDLEFALPLCSRVLVLNRGRMAFCDHPRALMRGQTVLRHSGTRLPLSFRLRAHLGLPHPFREETHSTTKEEIS